MGQIANRQSLVFSERGQLSQAIPQFHVERVLHQRMPIARFESQPNECRIYEDQILCFGGRYELQQTLAIRIAAITLVGERLRGNAIRGNRTESLRVENLPPRGPPKTSENLQEVPFCDLISITSVPLRGFRRPSQRKIFLSETLGPVAHNRVGPWPRGPNDQKVQSRSKFTISIEIFNLARYFESRRLDFPTKKGPRWVARSRVSISLEIWIFFWSLGLCESFSNHASDSAITIARFRPSKFPPLPLLAGSDEVWCLLNLSSLVRFTPCYRQAEWHAASGHGTQHGFPTGPATT